jgi:hypothetical protein
MRPTGKLHLGNYMGALYNWVRLQHEYNCYFFVADWHALTTDYADPSNIRENTMDVALDWLAAGLDPERCVLFVQSLVPQHAELHLLLSMIMPLGWLERVPTYKEQQLQIGDVAAGGKDLTTYGFLGYPLLMATDILIYQADFVPVGQDQVAHVEVTREVARRFNHFYPGPGEAILPEPQVLLIRRGYGGAIRAIRMFVRWAICTRSSRPLRRWLESMRGAGRRASAASSARAGPRTPSWPSCSPCRTGAGNMRSSPAWCMTFCIAAQHWRGPGLNRPWSR